MPLVKLLKFNLGIVPNRTNSEKNIYKKYL